MNFELFKSQLIRSLQDAGHSDTEIEEFRKILNSPIGELIVRAALMAAKKSLIMQRSLFLLCLFFFNLCGSFCLC